MTRMTKRILFGSVMIALLAGLFWLDSTFTATPRSGLPVGCLTVILVFVAYYEYARMADAAGLPAMALTGALLSAALATAPLWRRALGGAGAGASDALLLAAALAACFLAQMARHRLESAIRRIAGTLAGVVYLGLMAGFIIKIRMDYGVGVLVGFLATVKATDIGAYFTGTMIGRHKIIPWLSPGKSWEGLVGGMLASAATACVARSLTGSPASWLQAAVFGLAMTFVGQFGDLCESLLKRDAGVKDSAVMIPEFGGVLDLVDSPLVAAPAALALLGAIG